MAKKKDEAIEAPAEVYVPTRPTVLVLAGYDADGSMRTSRVEVDTTDHHPRSRVAHVGGEPLEHVADAADGEFIYSAGHAQGR